MMPNEAFYDDHEIIKLENPTNQVILLKRSMTLDLNVCNLKNSAEKPMLSPLLTSPDLHMLKMNTPELEQFYLDQQSVLGHINTPSPSLFTAESVIEEQEMYVQALVDQLMNQHNNETFQGDIKVQSPLTNNGNNSTEYESKLQYSDLMSSNYENLIPHLGIKDEKTVSSVTCSSPPMLPNNMESQEKIKLERKRQMNRVKASKSRNKKIERIAKLEDKVKLLKNGNSDLTIAMNRLTEQIFQLKQTVDEHKHSGCEFTIN